MNELMEDCVNFELILKRIESLSLLSESQTDEITSEQLIEMIMCDHEYLENILIHNAAQAQLLDSLDYAYMNRGRSVYHCIREEEKKRTLKCKTY